MNIDYSLVELHTSDHFARTIKVQSTQDAERGPTLWKYNNSLLKNNDYVSKIKNKRNYWKGEYINHDMSSELSGTSHVQTKKVKEKCVKGEKRKGIRTGKLSYNTREKFMILFVMELQLVVT